MITACTHCKKDLNLSPAHRVKIEQALANNKGKPVKFPCPQCKKPIEISAELKLQPNANKPKPASPSVGAEKTAVPKNPAPPEKKTQPSASAKSSGTDKEALEKKKANFPKPINPPPQAPEAPDIDWLMSGKLEEKKVVEDIPTAMILIPKGEICDKAAQVMKNFDYQLYFPSSSTEAIGKMRFKDYAAAVYHPSFEGKPMFESEFHQHICQIGMVKRRYMFYMLIGPDFHTLYDLEALAYSANLVVNDKEVSYLDVIMSKAKNDYDVLFGPFINLLKEYGKR